MRLEKCLSPTKILFSNGSRGSYDFRRIQEHLRLCVGVFVEVCGGGLNYRDFAFMSEHGVTCFATVEVQCLTRLLILYVVHKVGGRVINMLCRGQKEFFI